ncbi:MAG TPA: nickel pincer cofactor biosynthesis protein LarC [Lachnoclostridium sp.]|nr:nickel pincer cofactor biosynthesis protein LarC [Lachnoclostridium sp.]
MGKILYLECNSGISGDMTVGALLDLGADKQALTKALQSLGVDGYHLHFGRTRKCGLDAYDFDVHLENEGHDHKWDHNHDHTHDQDHEYDHNHDHDHDHDNDHSHSQGHDHSHKHDQSQIHRNLQDIYTIIDRLDSNGRVKAMAKRMFDIVAEAESKAHGIPMEKVHFHEVGAIDSIVDIIGVAVCVDSLGVDEIVVSPLAEGYGSIRCQHGVIPVPVPATANIVSAHGLKLRLTDNEGEMVTPTGAAIAAALGTRKNLPSSFQILKTGLGAGKKDFKQANVLRAMLLLEEEEGAGENMWVLEANIDDCSGESFGFAMESLLEAGAADVWYTPVFMKKNRPAYMLSLICREEEISRMEDILFIQTTTIGVRRYPVARTILDRKKKKVMTEFGEADVKICTYKDRTFCYPEFESVRSICRQNGLDYQTVYCIIRREAEK